jgi:hypothetical protein
MNGETCKMYGRIEATRDALSFDLSRGCALCWIVRNGIKARPKSENGRAGKIANNCFFEISRPYTRGVTA